MSFTRKELNYGKPYATIALPRSRLQVLWRTCLRPNMDTISNNNIGETMATAMETATVKPDPSSRLVLRETMTILSKPPRGLTTCQRSTDRCCQRWTWSPRPESLRKRSKVVQGARGAQGPRSPLDLLHRRWPPCRPMWTRPTPATRSSQSGRICADGPELRPAWDQG